MHIVVGREVDDARLEDMRGAFPGTTFTSVVQEPDSIGNADGFIGRIPPEVFALASDKLRWVHSTGAGVETIVAQPAIVASQIEVTNGRGAHAPFVAEHTLALLLAVNRNIGGFALDKANHQYQAYGRGLSLNSLYGKSMLIVGMGHIGRAIAQRAKGFDMNVIGVDLFAPATPEPALPVYPLDTLDEHLPTVDVVVVAVPYTEDTHDLISAARINSMKNDAILIGISRGRIINEEALAARLTEGTLLGAGLDVYAQEPLPLDHFLFDIPNLVMTPHCAPNSPLTRDREYEITHENIRRFVAGEPLINVCDKNAGF